MLTPSELSSFALSALDDAKAIDVVRIDVRGLTDLTDYMIICNGNSDRHVSALARQVIDRLNKENCKPMNTEGDDVNEWILIDYVDVIVHVMKSETRALYDLESLWDERLLPHSAQN